VGTGDTTHVPTSGGVFTFCETTQDYLKTSELVGNNETFGAGWNSDTGVPEKDDIYDALGNEDFFVCVSTPNLLTATIGYQVTPYYSYAVTYSTITARCVTGTSYTFMIEQRTSIGSNAAGTDVFTGDIIATSVEFKGGTFADATVPSGSALFLVPTSWAGNNDSFMIKGIRTRD
jgi:hypothetical protein